MPRFVLGTALVLLIAVCAPLFADQIPCVDYERHTRLLSVCHLDAHGVELAVRGDLAFVCSVANDLEVVDLADSLEPRLLASVPSAADPVDLCLVGDRAYVAATPIGVMTYDIADPANPVLLSTVAVTGSQTSIASDGQFLVLGRDNDGLACFDLADPDEPALIGTMASSSDVVDVALKDGLVFAATYVGLDVVDFAVPEQPVTVASVPVDNVKSLVIDGGVLYLGSYAEGVRIYDVSSPQSPALVGAIDMQSQVQRLDKLGQRIFLQTRNQGTMVYDVSDPAAPQHLTDLDTFGPVATFRFPDRVVHFSGASLVVRALGGLEPLGPAASHAAFGYDPLVGHGDLLAAGTYSGNLDIFDAADPENLVLLSSVEAGANHPGVAFDGQRLAVGDHDGVRLYDLSDPATPVGLGAFPGLGVMELAMVGDEVWAVEQEEVWNGYFIETFYYLRGLDFGDPSAPVELYFDSLPAYGSLDLAGDVLYYASQPELRVLDVSNPTDPQELLSHPWNDNNNGFLLDGDRAFLVHSWSQAAVGGWSRLLIWDVSDPGSPTEVASLPLPAVGRGLARHGDELFVASGESILRLDIGDETAPRLAGQVVMPINAGPLTLAGGHLWTSWVSLHMIPFDCSSLPVGVLDDGLPSPRPSVRAVPNPFNPMTSVHYRIPTAGRVTVTVHDLAGREVIRLVDADREAGAHAVRWDGRDRRGRAMGSGVYLVRVAGDGYAGSAKLSLIR